jgi:hypothetical protein
LAAERNSFADRINEQRPSTDPLSAIATLLRARQIEVRDPCQDTPEILDCLERAASRTAAGFARVQ